MTKSESANTTKATLVHLAADDSDQSWGDCNICYKKGGRKISPPKTGPTGEISPIEVTGKPPGEIDKRA